MSMFGAAFRRIHRQFQRSILTMIGISIGMLTIIVISFIGQVGMTVINGELNSVGMDGLVVSASATMGGGFSEQDLERVSDNEQVSSVTPLLTNYTRAKIKGAETDCLLWGINEDSTDIVEIELLHGRLLTPEDIATNAPVCLLEESYALLQYGRSNIVGKELEVFLNGHFQSFEIVGITRGGGDVLQTMMGQVIPCFAYLPYTTLQQYTNNFSFQTMMLSPVAQSDTEALSRTITAQFDAGTVTVEDLNNQRDQVNQILDMITTILTVIGGISLIVAGLSIMTTMLISVQQRTHEIGVKKAIGATDGMIVLEVLTESFLLTLSGAVVGTVTTVLLCVGICLLLDFPIVYDFPLWIGCILLSSIFGTLCGIYPALHAARLQPVDLLQNS